MSALQAASAATNPFSTRYVRPGAIRFVFDGNTEAGQLIERLASFDWRAQIVGPHGSGKSTLLATLSEPLRTAGRPAFVVALHDGQRRMPHDWIAGAHAAAARLIVVDGYEQLSRLSRWKLARRCRREDWGLVVTAHRDAGLPTLARIVPSAEVAQRVVDLLLSTGRGAITREVVADAFQGSNGNVREMLFALYDRFEHTRHGQDR